MKSPLSWDGDLAIALLPSGSETTERIANEIIQGCFEPETTCLLTSDAESSRGLFLVVNNASIQNTWRRFIQANHLLLSVIAIAGYQVKGRGVTSVIHPRLRRVIRGTFSNAERELATAQYYPIEFLTYHHPQISIVSPGNEVAAIKAKRYDPDTEMVVFLIDVAGAAPHYVSSFPLHSDSYAVKPQELGEIVRGGPNQLKSMWNFGDPCQ